ncbi:type II secretion system protein [Solibacillus sp. FSL W7-1436]|uniref:type II secretion system protein n=1 Tax=Solibacillus TaxID=648800 RepID=UPI00203E6563|nr:type II secretion system protein [Solibacillus isronensis]MCM3723146.1 type II secretion system GspH family protein [Solibacillus isronensis]
MKRYFKNYIGFTLVETLAAIVIFSIVMILVFSTLNSSVEQNKEQTAEAFQINDAAFMLKQITKDIRKSYKINPSKNPYLFMDENDNLLFNYTYNSETKTLSRNDVIIVNNIEDFNMSWNEHTVSIYFTLNNQDYTTTIAFRKGDK